MKRANLLHILFGTLLFVSVQGCIKDEILIKDPGKFTRPINIGAPIGQIDISAKDLLEKIDSTSFFEIDDDGLIHFRLDTSFTAEWTDLISFEDMSLIQQYDINPTTKIVKSFVDTIVVNFDRTQRFDSLFLKTADLHLSITTPNGLTGSYMVSFPEIFDSNGDSVVLNAALGANANETFDLANGKMVLGNKNGKSYFLIRTTVDVNEVANLPGNTNLELQMNMQNFVPEVVFGYFGKVEAIHTEQDLEFNFFDAFDFSEMVEFKDIAMDITINNYFGVPLGLYIDTLVFENTTKNTTLPVTINGDSIIIDASPQYQVPITPSVNNLVINSENSNLIDGINLGPNRIYYEVTGYVNPQGEPETPNFINTSTKIEADASVDIPFWFKTSLYERTDPIKLDFVDLIGDSSRLDYLEEIDLYLTFENGFPFNISAQIYMADENDTYIDSVFEVTPLPLFWKSGTIDENGLVTSPSTTLVDIQILQEKAHKLYQQKATKLIIKSRVSTGNAASPEFVKLLDEYSLHAKLSLEVISGDIN